MNTDSPSPRPTAFIASKTAAADGSYLDWPAILAWLIGAPLLIVIIVAVLL